MTRSFQEHMGLTLYADDILARRIIHDGKRWTYANESDRSWEMGGIDAPCWKAVYFLLRLGYTMSECGVSK